MGFNCLLACADALAFEADPLKGPNTNAWGFTFQRSFNTSEVKILKTFCVCVSLNYDVKISHQHAKVHKQIW